MKKIMLAVQRLDKFGGAQRVITNLANCYSRDGYETSLLTMLGGECVYGVDGGVKRLNVASVCGESRSIGAKLKKIVQIRKFLKEERPDIVVTFHIDITFFLLIAMTGLNIPVVVSERHDPKVTPRRKSLRILRKLLYPGVDGFVFQTEEAKSFFSEKIGKRSVVIGNPVREDLPDIDGEKIFNNEIVSAGRLEAVKNHALLLEAFSDVAGELPEYVIKIYGEGSQRENLEKKILELGLEGRAELCGTVKDLPSKIKDSALFVLTSNYEGIPNVLLEAMALGIPSISTNCPCGGPELLIENGVNGLLIQVGDRKALGEDMVKLLKDTELRDMISENAVGVRQRFALQKIYNDWKTFTDRFI